MRQGRTRQTAASRRNEHRRRNEASKQGAIHSRAIRRHRIPNLTAKASKARREQRRRNRKTENSHDIYILPASRVEISGEKGQGTMRRRTSGTGRRARRSKARATTGATQSKHRRRRTTNGAASDHIGQAGERAAPTAREQGKQARNQTAPPTAQKNEKERRTRARGTDRQTIRDGTERQRWDGKGKQAGRNGKTNTA